MNFNGKRLRFYALYLLLSLLIFFFATKYMMRGGRGIREFVIITEESNLELLFVLLLLGSITTAFLYYVNFRQKFKQTSKILYLKAIYLFLISFIIYSSIALVAEKSASKTNPLTLKVGIVNDINESLGGKYGTKHYYSIRIKNNGEDIKIAVYRTVANSLSSGERTILVVTKGYFLNWYFALLPKHNPKLKIIESEDLEEIKASLHREINSRR